MSLFIETDKVTDVLLADGWHKVDPLSFDLDSYEFMDRKYEGKEQRTVFGGGQDKLVPATGAVWWEGEQEVVCPITSIIALKVSK